MIGRASDNAGHRHRGEDYTITKLHKCRDAMKIDRHHGVQIDEIDPLDGCVQSWLHPRVGLDSHR